jgi:hypothetical protein
MEETAGRPWREVWGGEKRVVVVVDGSSGGASTTRTRRSTRQGGGFASEASGDRHPRRLLRCYLTEAVKDYRRRYPRIDASKAGYLSWRSISDEDSRFDASDADCWAGSTRGESVGCAVLCPREGVHLSCKFSNLACPPAVLCVSLLQCYDDMIHNHNRVFVIYPCLVLLFSRM